VLDNIELADFQTVSVLRSLYMKNGLFLFETGLGKTVTACATMKAIINAYPGTRFIYFVKKPQLTQTPYDLRKWGGLKVVWSTAESDVLRASLSSVDLRKADVLMLTHETLADMGALYWLYQYIERFSGIIVDEAHNLSNFRESNRSWMLSCLLPRFEWRYGLTATPIINNPRQLADLLYIFWPQYFNDIKNNIKEISEGTEFVDKYKILLHNVSRKNLGIDIQLISTPEWVEPHPWQRYVNSGDRLFEITKGSRAENQANSLIKVILHRKSEGKRGLVYVFEHKIREWILPFLDNNGIKYSCINGQVTDLEARKKTQEDFAKGDLDVVITSVFESLNLDCHYMVLYEFPSNLDQFIGRGIRGLGSKALELIWIFTANSPEVPYFIDHTYANSKLVQTSLGREYSEIMRMAHMLVQNEIDWCNDVI